MSDKATQSCERHKQPFNKNHPDLPDYAGDNPMDIPSGKVADDTLNPQSTADQQHERNHRAEQQLKQQEREQNDRSAFQKGSAQEHQQRNREH